MTSPNNSHTAHSHSAHSHTATFQLSRARFILLFVLALLFVIVGVAIFIGALTADSDGASSRGQSRQWIGLVFGPIAVIFFGFGAFVLARKMVSRNMTGLELRPDGFVDRTSAVAMNKLVPWSEVRAYDFLQQQRQRYLVFVLHDPEGFGERYIDGRLAQMTFSANLRMMGPVHAVALNNLKTKPEEIVAAIGQVTDGRLPRFQEQAAA